MLKSCVADRAASDENRPHLWPLRLMAVLIPAERKSQHRELQHLSRKNSLSGFTDAGLFLEEIAVPARNHVTGATRNRGLFSRLEYPVPQTGVSVRGRAWLRILLEFRQEGLGFLQNLS